mmetsp:Transcript_130415/g.244004  ORF Transcript_130415/g.244004 Transcript_130415/m.244004 type:complete len:265 (+) Transcript_130415:2-796(+)
MLNYRKAPFPLVRQQIVNMFHIFPPLAATANVEGEVDYGNGRGNRRLSSSLRRLGNWDNRKTLELAQMSEAYISQALERMSRREIGDTVMKWYGTNDEVTRTEVKRVMNGVHAMLGYVEYVYPGSMCQPNYYAYVYPTEAYENGKRLDRNSQGQYIFYLCDYYFKVGDSGKVETLLHEGAHHLAMALADSQYQGNTLYGKSACMKAASDCNKGSTHACVQTLRNADSFCYFVNEAHTAEAKPEPSTQTGTQTAINQASLDLGFR